jgi:hypothetical protein
MARQGHNGHNGNGHGHLTETPDVSHIKNIDVTHEVSDVNVIGIVKFVVGLTVFGIIVSALMWGLFWFLNAQEQKQEPRPGPMAMTEQERLPPEPRLQAARGFGVKLQNGEWVNLEKREPEAEYRVLREQWERQLNCKDTSNAGCVPIDVAMEKLLETGLPVRAQETGQTGDVALPTAASSGRKTEKGTE